MTLPPHECRSLPARHLGRQLLVFPQLDSTNTLALSLATDPSHHGLVLLAKEQTAGRGQYGRSWHAPAGSSVLMSVLIFPPPELCRPAMLVAWAAVSVCELIGELTGLPATIKWPNDVLAHGKKVCGILTEQRNSGDRDRPLATVVGLGLNVSQPGETFAEAGLPDAGSLWSLSGRRFETDEVACRLIGRLDADYDRLLHGDAAAIESLWKQRLGLCGTNVRLVTASQVIHGRLMVVAFDGVDVQLDDGAIVRLAPESVRNIHTA
jgi:BirA family biotin operon repressor/biotin-[acetyl-CoA-carboxylase] ligase